MHIPKIFLSLVIFAVTAGAEVPQGSSQPVGMILEASGSVFLERSAQRTPARLAELLQAGDRVIVNSGATAFLFCPSQEQIRVEGQATLELAAADVRVIQGQPPIRKKVGGCALPRVSLGSESLERVGGLRARGYPPIVLYVGGRVPSSRPNFQWEPVEETESYLVRIRNEMGAVVWEHRTDLASMAYPESQSPLEEKDYQWEVTAEKNGETLAQQWANFSVKPNADLAGKGGDDLSSKLLRATELENAEYFSRAADYYRELREQHPEDIRLTRRLAWLYWNAGLIAASNQERQRLSSQLSK